MKASELMIGDYVKFLGRIRKIKSIISKDTGVEISFEGKNTVVVSLDEIEPIPLTREILEKNGWKWNHYHTGIKVTIGTLHIVWGFYENCISVSDWAEDADSQITSLRCRYVHTLQNTLRLCGIEKEIEL